MPDNKSLDGIKKLSEQDLKKARDVVLQSIGEKSKTAKPIGGISQDEARKIEAATEKFKPKQVDGLVVRRKTENRRQKTDGRKQTADNGYVFVSADFEAAADRAVQDREKLVKAKAEQLKLKRQIMREKKAMKKKQKLERIEQERLKQEKMQEKLGKEKIEQLKHKNKKIRKHKNNETQQHLPRLVKAGKKTKTQKRTPRVWLGERGVNAQSRLLIISYLLLILTLIIIVGSVGFFTIWYNLNNYAVLAKASKVKQMMEAKANFYQIAKSQGDEFGVGKYYTYNEATVKFGQNIVNLEIGQISIIKHTDSGYYLVQCYGRKENLIGLKYIFIKSRSLDDYVSEMMSRLWIWSLAD